MVRMVSHAARRVAINTNWTEVKNKVNRTCIWPRIDLGIPGLVSAERARALSHHVRCPMEAHFDLTTHDIVEPTHSHSKNN